ncbi:MAG: hypothetical protein KatS3mg057_2008 [Herpetosiphonaceae bacterium]|nr:MAG: hypothetical protein KatS3mg057_2008 [Herpetosiphonaceae bacterium]
MAVRQLLRGAAAGLAATVPMTIAMEFMYRYLPWWQRYSLPPGQITARLTRAIGLRRKTERREHNLLTFLGHFGYGATVGAIYAPIARRLKLPSLLGGVVYGLAVWFVSYVGWLPAFHILPSATKQPNKRNALMITAHIVYGASLSWLLDQMRETSREEAEQPAAMRYAGR